MTKEEALKIWLPIIKMGVKDIPECNEAFDMATKALEREPKTGRWEHGKELGKEYRGRILIDVIYEDWHCGNCNYVIKQSNKPKWNYCPNCGVRMQEVEE